MLRCPQAKTVQPDWRGRRLRIATQLCLGWRLDYEPEVLVPAPRARGQPAWGHVAQHCAETVSFFEWKEIGGGKKENGFPAEARGNNCWRPAEFPLSEERYFAQHAWRASKRGWGPAKPWSSKLAWRRVACRFARAPARAGDSNGTGRWALQRPLPVEELISATEHVEKKRILSARLAAASSMREPE